MRLPQGIFALIYLLEPQPPPLVSMGFKGIFPVQMSGPNFGELATRGGWRDPSLVSQA